MPVESIGSFKDTKASLDNLGKIDRKALIGASLLSALLASTLETKPQTPDPYQDLINATFGRGNPDRKDADPFTLGSEKSSSPSFNESFLMTPTALDNTSNHVRSRYPNYYLTQPFVVPDLTDRPISTETPTNTQSVSQSLEMIPIINNKYLKNIIKDDQSIYIIKEKMKEIKLENFILNSYSTDKLRRMPRTPTFEEQEAARIRQAEVEKIARKRREEEVAQAAIRRAVIEAEQRANYIPQVAVFKTKTFYLEASSAAFGLSRSEEALLKFQMVQFFRDKGFDLRAGFALAQLQAIGPLFNHLVLRSGDDSVDDFLNSNFTEALDNRYKGFTSILDSSKPWLDAKAKYEGTPTENGKVDSAIAQSADKTRKRRKFSGRGATRLFKLGLNAEEKIAFGKLVRNVPAIVIGGGPAGLMATRAMIEMGFDPDNIVVLDKTGEYGGIWNQKNVVGGSKNNPFEFDFEGVTLPAAPGSGGTVSEFLKSVEDSEKNRFRKRLPCPVKGTVVSVQPGDLNHIVTYKTSKGEITRSVPIVINALGNGKPLDPNREGYMTTDTPREAGIRWQQILTPERAERYRGKTLLFIGLGNSTAEMLVQINRLNEQGLNIDYRVITHYPHDAVANPDQQIVKDGKTFRVFRDTTVPNLTKWEGDLTDAREVYFKALEENKILSDITHWHLENGIMTLTTTSGEQQTLECEQLFTLIGYGHDPEMLKAMGMTVTDSYLGTIAYDYDGEIQKQVETRGRERVFAGYFGLGSLLKSRENPNGVVMPGIMHRMYDLLFSAGIRAVEYEIRQKGLELTLLRIQDIKLERAGLNSFAFAR